MSLSFPFLDADNTRHVLTTALTADELAAAGLASQATAASILAALNGTLDVADASAETALAAILAKLSADPATQTTLAAVLAKLPALNGDGGAQAHITNFPATQPVSATALPLPAGAATETTLAAVNTKLGGTLAVADSAAETALTAILAKLIAAPATAANQTSELTKLDQLHTDLIAATPAGENHLGEVGGNVGVAQATFGPSSSTTYAAGQCMAAPIKLAGLARVNGGSGLIVNASLELAAANTQQVDLVVFNAAPAGSYTSGATFTLASGDRSKVSKVIKLTDWTALGAADSLGEAVSAPKFFKCADATDQTALWVLPVARGSITLASATDATLTLRTARN